MRLDYADREPDTYVLPIAWATGTQADDIQQRNAEWILTRVAVVGHQAAEGIVYDAIGAAPCAAALLRLFVTRQHAKGAGGEILALRTSAFVDAKLRATAAASDVLAEEQSNSTIRYGETAVLKLLRSVDEGAHPEVTTGAFLTRRRFPHAPTVLGALEYRRRRSEPIVLAILQRFVPNEGDAWEFILRMLESYRRDVRNRPGPMMSTPSLSAAALLKASDTEVPPFVEELLGSHLPAVRRLGQRTGELHRTLGAARAPSDLAPEPFSILYQRSAYQRLRGLTRSVLQTLRERLPVLGVDHRADAVHVVAAEQELLHRCRPLLAQRLTAVRIACHGNYHLRQVLRTGEDFVIIDFEGEPARPLFERRLKRSPLVDVGSRVRSFYYAAGVALHDEMSGTADGSDAVRDLHRWSMFRCHWIAAAFLRAYRSAVDSALLPADPDQLRLLVELSLLERTLYELGYELAHRPGWAYIPLRDLRRLLEHRPYALAS